mgnify:CR=1 FL=1
MKKFGDMWWLCCIVTVIAYFFYHGALADLKEYADSVSGWSGFFAGFLHGLVLDLDFGARVEKAYQYQELVTRALLWQNVFRFWFLVSVVSVGLKIWFVR